MRARIRTIRECRGHGGCDGRAACYERTRERVTRNLAAPRINNSRCGYGNARPADRPILNFIYARSRIVVVSLLLNGSTVMDHVRNVLFAGDATRESEMRTNKESRLPSHAKLRATFAKISQVSSVSVWLALSLPLFFLSSSSSPPVYISFSPTLLFLCVLSARCQVRPRRDSSFANNSSSCGVFI